MNVKLLGRWYVCPRDEWNWNLFGLKILIGNSRDTQKPRPIITSTNKRDAGGVGYSELDLFSTA